MRHKADTKIKNNKNELALHRACCTDNNIGVREREREHNVFNEISFLDCIAADRIVTRS